MRRRFINANVILLSSVLLLTLANLGEVLLADCGPNQWCIDRSAEECYGWCLLRGGCKSYTYYPSSYCEQGICWETWKIECNNGEYFFYECGSYDPEDC